LFNFRVTSSTLKFAGKIGLNIKNNKMPTRPVGTVIKSNSKIVGGDKMDTPNTQIQDRSLY